LPPPTLWPWSEQSNRLGIISLSAALPEQVNDDATDPAEFRHDADVGSLLAIKAKTADERHDKTDYAGFEQALKSLRNHPLSVPPMNREKSFAEVTYRRSVDRALT
jgi:hypothetical protein